jgi:hypothetical protein
MALMIRETIDHEDANGFFSEAASESVHSLDLTEGRNVEADEPIDPNSLMVEIEGIHGYPHATRNYTRYMPECLIDSTPSWTKPYRRPLIKHHNDKDGDIIGRVCAAEYVTKSGRSKTPAVKFTVNVSEEEAKKGVKDGRLDTVSIGVIATDVRCSICGKQLSDGDMCEHERGIAYQVGNKLKTCYWDIYSMEAKELSYVIVPSDIYAKNNKVYPATQSGAKPQITESLDNTLTKKENKTMAEPNANAEKELAEAKTKISELDAKVKELEEAKTASDTKITELTEAKAGLEGQVTELTEAKKTLEEGAEEAKQLREGLETEIADTKAKLKESMVQTLQAVRLATGKKELEAESVKSRTEDSIRDSIMDLKEEFSIKFKKAADPVIPKPNSVQDPTITEGAKGNDQKLNVKESNTDSNINLKDALGSLLTDTFNTHK